MPGTAVDYVWSILMNTINGLFMVNFNGPSWYLGSLLEPRFEREALLAQCYSELKITC